MFFEMQETYNERVYSIHEQSAVATDVVFLLMCVCLCVCKPWNSMRSVRKWTF